MFLSAVMGEARAKEESLRRMSDKLIKAQEQERQRIARELHDNLGQELAMVNVALDSLVEGSSAPLNSALMDLSKQVFSISEITREISHGLYPTTLEYVGRENAPSVQLMIGDMRGGLDSSTSLSLYRITQEALHNILKHSQARNVRVDLSSDQRRVILRITDDGIGFDINMKTDGVGLPSMRQRIQALGGSIEISSSRRAGTQIEVQIPVQQTPQDSKA
jgi:signal transduction histidine kinase